MSEFITAPRDGQPSRPSEGWAGTRRHPSLPAAGAQGPEEKGDRVYRVGTSAEPDRGSEGPQGSIREDRRLGQAPLRGQEAPFLGKRTIF